MREWRECKLGDVCLKIGSGATPTGGQGSYKNSGISLIRSQNVLDLGFSYQGLAFIDDAQASKLNNVTVEENDVLINITGDSVARVCKVPQNVLPARVNQHVSIVRANKTDLNCGYLLYWLIDMKEYLLSISEIGATRRAITKQMLDNLSISMPSLPNQRAIAEVLGNLDDKIELLHRQNKTLEEIADVYFRQWFVEEAGEEMTTIGEYVTLENESSNPAKSPLDIFHHYSIPAFDNAKVPVRELGQEILSNKFKVKPNTILVSKLNPVKPRIWLIGNTVPVNSVCSTEFLVLKPKSSNCRVFLYFLLKANDVVEFLAMSASGTSGSHQRIRPEYILNVEIAKPHTGKIELFGRIFGENMEKIHANTAQIRTLISLRDTLLPKIVSGEVRVKT